MKKFILATCETVILAILILLLMLIANDRKPTSDLIYFIIVFICAIRTFLKYELL